MAAPAKLFVAVLLCTVAACATAARVGIFHDAVPAARQGRQLKATLNLAGAQLDLTGATKAKVSLTSAINAQVTAKGVTTNAIDPSLCVGADLLGLTACLAAFDPECCNGIVGDPHFIGFEGTKYDFTGVAGHSYCVVSDPRVQLNGFIGGVTVTDPKAWHFGKSFTWFYGLAVLYKGHKMEFHSRRGPVVDWAGGYLSKAVIDGEEVKLAEGEARTFAGGEITYSFEKANYEVLVFGQDRYQADRYRLTIKGELVLEMILRPAHPDLRTADEAAVHFDMSLPSIKLTQQAHGILGQTYPEKRLKASYDYQLTESFDHVGMMVAGPNAEGFIDGTVEDYEVSNLLAADCKFNRFGPVPVDAPAAEGAAVMRRLL